MVRVSLMLVAAITLAFLLPTRGWADTNLTPVPNDERALSEKLLQRLTPINRAKVHALSIRVGSESKTQSGDLEAMVSLAVRDEFPDLHETDSEALAFLVLMGVTQDLDRDLSMIGEVKTSRHAKNRLGNSEILTTTKMRPHVDPTGPASMNEMSEMTSLRLQMAMDRRSKLVSTLSNVMKKISETQDTLVQNLK